MSERKLFFLCLLLSMFFLFNCQTKGKVNSFNVKKFYIHSYCIDGKKHDKWGTDSLNFRRGYQKNIIDENSKLWTLYFYDLNFRNTPVIYTQLYLMVSNDSSFRLNYSAKFRPTLLMYNIIEIDKPYNYSIFGKFYRDGDTIILKGNNRTDISNQKKEFLIKLIEMKEAEKDEDN